MTKKLPSYLKGPFTTAKYDYREGIIYLKTEKGEIVSTRTYPSFFIKKKDKKKFPVEDFPKLVLDYIEEGDYLRIITDPSVRRDKLNELLNACLDEEVKTYEADVSPVRRWFSDTGALVSKKFRCLFFDLETDPQIIGFSDEAKRSHRIISYAAYDQEGNSWFKAATESTDEQEAVVIKHLLKVAKGYDVLLAWNGDDYDFFVLKSRVRHLNIKVDWRQWNLLDYMLVVKRTLSSIPDPAFKRSFALDSVGENILGIRKIKLSVPAGKMYRLLKTSTTRAELEVYNRRDVEIMLGVDKKREFLTLHSALCSICRTFPNRSSVFPNELADGILLRLAVQEGVHFPTRIQTSVEENKYEGAFVLEPVTGFHMDVQVPDFASLYPSIILSWNMSNETKIQDDEELTRDVLSNSALASATGVRFRTDVEGIIPKALKQLISKRNEYKERAKKLPVDSDEYRNVGHLSTAVKVATNSFYGLIGSEVSRYYDRDIARSVTLTGQYLVRETIKFFEGKGHEVVGADTDSTFVKCSMSLMNEYLEEINDQFIPRILSRVGCKDNYVRMDFDKGYKSLLITTKKRYAGKLALWKGRPAPDDMAPEVKGLEVQRSDETRYTQQLLKEFIDILLSPDVDPLDIDNRLIAEAKKFYTIAPPRELIEITKTVTKPPSEYRPMTTAARIAQQMIDNGREFFVGMKIPFIVVDHTPIIKAIHADEYVDKFDREYYWSKRILPPILRLVHARFPKYSFRDFENPMQEQFNFDDKPAKVKKMRSVKKVRKVVAPVKRIKKPPVFTIHIPDGATKPTISGIALLAKSMKGNCKIHVSVNMCDADAIIHTDTMVSRDCLKEISKMFNVAITPKPV